jgi:hypothetical protein
MFAHLSPDQQALAEYMSRLSEEGFRAGWMEDIEYLLWTAVTGSTAGMRWTLKDEEVEKLRELSELCHGWIVYEGGHHCFLPLEEWERRYRAHQAERTIQIEGRLYSREEFQAEVDARRRRLVELRQMSQVAQRDLEVALAEFFGALLSDDFKWGVRDLPV